MDLNAIINPVWNTLSDKLWKSYFEKIKSYYTGTTLNLTNCTGDNLLNLTIGGNSEQIPEHNVRSVEGTAVRVDDSFGGSIKNITQYGQCDISGTPSTETPATITGRVAGGTVYGKNLIDYTKIVENPVTSTFDYKIILSVIKNTNYTLSSNLPNDYNGAAQIYFNGATSYINGAWENNSVTINSGDSDELYIGFYNRGTLQNVLNGTYYVQFEQSSTATPYEPYKTPISYTVTDANGQSVTLYGIPVTSGGNVTIDGQQYIADYIKDGVGHRKIGIYTFYGNEKFVYLNEAFTCQNKGSANIRNNCISTHFVYKFVYNDGTDHVLFSDAWYFYKQDCTTVEQFKAYLAAQYAAGTPVTVYYVLASETTFPVTVNTVNAYAPTTTWLSDCYTSAELAVTGQGNVTLPTPTWQVPITNTGKLVTEGEHAGKYAVKVKVSGKNLIDLTIPSSWDLGNNTFGIVSCIKQSDGTYIANGTTNAVANRNFKVNPNGILTLRKGVSYYISGLTLYNGSTTIVVCRKDEAKKYTPTIDMKITTISSITTTTTEYQNLVIKPYIIISDTEPAYEPYHEPVYKTIYLDAPLRKGDTLEVVGGKLIRKFAEINLAELRWLCVNNGDSFYFRANIDDAKCTETDAIVPKCMSTSYAVDSASYVEGYRKGVDKTFSITANNRVVVRDDYYKDAVNFKSAMSGVMLEYELATPVEIDISGQDIPTFDGTTIVTVEDVDSQPESLTATYWQEA